MFMLLKHHVPFLVKGGERQAPVTYVDDLCCLFVSCGGNRRAFGKEYIGIPVNGFGMHDIIRRTAIMMDMPYPQKILPKWPLILAAHAMALRYRIFKGKKPKLTTRIVNALSARKRQKGTAEKDLGWAPVRSLEEIVDKMVNN
jgi:nucleoside-diphosphate-sugar epimerase